MSIEPRGADTPLLRRILVSIDFSSPNEAALAYAAAIGNGFGAELDVLYVWPDADETIDVAGLLDRFATTEMAHQMEAFLEALERRTSARLRGRIALGEPAAAILRIATREPYDLILLGASGSEEVLRQAPCAVLKVPNRVPAHA